MEIDPARKERLYEALDEEGITLKEWFLRQMGRYIEERLQPSLFSESTPSDQSGGKS